MVRIAILTVSDRAFHGQREDRSGPALVQAVTEQGWTVVETGLVPDEQEAIRDVLLAWCARPDVDIILTTGGTGFGPRDVTPEATRTVIEREAPGLAEAMRAASLRITPHAMLSRAIAGIRGHALIINLPGSPKAAVENFAVVAAVLPHAVQLLRGDAAAEHGHRAAP